jgi:hypothetical protein
MGPGGRRGAVRNNFVELRYALSIGICGVPQAFTFHLCVGFVPPRVHCQRGQFPIEDQIDQFAAQNAVLDLAPFIFSPPEKIRD